MFVEIDHCDVAFEDVRDRVPLVTTLRVHCSVIAANFYKGRVRQVA